MPREIEGPLSLPVLHASSSSAFSSYHPTRMGRKDQETHAEVRHGSRPNHRTTFGEVHPKRGIGHQGTQPPGSQPDEAIVAEDPENGQKDEPHQFVNRHAPLLPERPVLVQTEAVESSHAERDRV